MLLQSRQNWGNKMNKRNEYMKSQEWKARRIQLINDRGMKCEKCGWSEMPEQLQIHHKNYDQEPGKENDEDLMVLCDECHFFMHKSLGDFESDSNIMEVTPGVFAKADPKKPGDPK